MKIEARDVSDGGTVKYSLAQLTLDEFHCFWPHISSMLDKIPHTWKHWTKDYIVTSVKLGSLVTWCIGPPPDAVFVFFTQISVYPTGRILIVPWGAGTFNEDMLPLLDATLTQYAQFQDCSSIEIRGRPGWEKVMKPIGFNRECVVLSRPVPKSRIH